MFLYGQPGGGGAVGGLNERKQALIKKLSGQNKGQGGAARLSGGVPFGAMPRLGHNPNARSVFQQGGEQFNFAGGPPGFEAAAQATQGAFGAPPQQQPNNAPIGGVGPAAGSGSGSPGLPQGGGSSYGSEGGTTHLLEAGNPLNGPGNINGAISDWANNPQGQTGAIPIAVQNAFNGEGAMSSGVAAWLQQNPWFMDQLGMSGGGGGGTPTGGGAIL